MPVQRRKQTRQSGSFDHRSSLFVRPRSFLRTFLPQRSRENTQKHVTPRYGSQRIDQGIRRFGAVEAREAVATSRVSEANKRKREGTWSGVPLLINKERSFDLGHQRSK